MSTQQDTTNVDVMLEMVNSKLATIGVDHLFSQYDKIEACQQHLGNPGEALKALLDKK